MPEKGMFSGMTRIPGGGNGVSIKAGDGCGGRFPEDI
jgi:hypothetical protein